MMLPCMAKGTFAGIIKFKVLRWRDNHESSGWHQQGPLQEGGKRLRVREGDVIRKAEVRGRQERS